VIAVGHRQEVPGGKDEVGTPAIPLYPPRGRRGLDPRRTGEFLQRLERFRRLHMLLPDPRTCGAVHIFDLSNLPARFGPRWPQLGEKAWQIIEHALDGALEGEDLYVAVDPATIYTFTSGANWRDAEREMKLLAARMTERLCGLVAGGASVRVRTLPFDLRVGLAGLSGLRELRERVEAFGRRLEDEERQAFARVESTLEVRFSPVIGLRRLLVLGHRLHAGRPGDDGRFVEAAELCPDRALGVFDAAVDGWLVRTLARLASAHRCLVRGLVVVPVHYETLATRHLREQLVATLQTLPRPLARRLVVYLPDLPPAIPQSALVRLSGLVAPFVRALAGSLPLARPDVERFDGTAVRILAVPAKEFTALPPDLVLRRLARLLEAARRGRRRRVWVVDLADAAMFELAREAGVDALEGPVFGPPLPAPLPRRSLRTVRERGP